MMGITIPHFTTFQIDFREHLTGKTWKYMWLVEIAKFIRCMRKFGVARSHLLANDKKLFVIDTNSSTARSANSCHPSPRDCIKYCAFCLMLSSLLDVLIYFVPHEAAFDQLSGSNHIYVHYSLWRHHDFKQGFSDILSFQKSLHYPGSSFDVLRSRIM